jgi:hypothetical protein
MFNVGRSMFHVLSHLPLPIPPLIAHTAAPFVLAMHHIPAQHMLHELDSRLFDEVVFGVG